MILPQPTIYLASRSPRRAELLQQIGIGFVVIPSDIDESVVPGEAAADYVLRLAREKAAVGYTSLREQNLPAQPVLAADTTVAIGGNILGKPEEDPDGYEAGVHRMLSMMAGEWHEVHTGIALATADGVQTAISTTRVQMGAISSQTIQAYIASGEPRGKAGAYGIQGLASVLIQRIEGSYSGVMGLPIFETAALLKTAGIHAL